MRFSFLLRATEAVVGVIAVAVKVEIVEQMDGGEIMELGAVDCSGVFLFFLPLLVLISGGVGTSSA